MSQLEEHKVDLYFQTAGSGSGTQQGSSGGQSSYRQIVFGAYANPARLRIKSAHARPLHTSG